MTYTRQHDKEYTSSSQYHFKSRAGREDASRSAPPFVFRFWVKERGVYGCRKNVLWMGLSTQSEDGGFEIDKQGRLHFMYAGPDGAFYTGRGYEQEKHELATMNMIEGFDPYGDSYERPNKARRDAHADMCAARVASEIGTSSLLLYSHY
jgi:hypothetical protein